jgi:hypothetical protein
VDTGLAIFHLSMLPDLFGVPREAISGDEMVARLDHTLFA